MCLVKAIRSDAVYFALSALLHVLAVVTTLSWLSYVLRYMNCPRRCRHVIQFVLAAQLLSEVVFVTANFFSPMMFRIVDGEYVLMDTQGTGQCCSLRSYRYCWASCR